MIDDIRISAGTIWHGPDGQTIEWLRDIRTCETVDVDCLLINGNKPEPGDVFPEWTLGMSWDGVCYD